MTTIEQVIIEKIDNGYLMMCAKSAGELASEPEKYFYPTRDKAVVAAVDYFKGELNKISQGVMGAPIESIYPQLSVRTREAIRQAHTHARLGRFFYKEIKTVGDLCSYTETEITASSRSIAISFRVSQEDA